MKPFSGFLITVFFATLWQAASFAQVPEPAPVVIAGGGGNANDGTLYLSDTVGQPVIGIMGDATQLQSAGFWFVTDRLHIGPTSAVLFASFAAATARQGVELEWFIASADGLQGFNIYRSNDAWAAYMHINTGALLPAGETSFIDPNVEPSPTYWSRVGAVDADGEFLSLAQSVTIPPREAELYQNYPNPFNPTTHIDFYVPTNDMVVLEVFDVGGARVETLVSEPTGFGHHSVTWNGTDRNGRRVSSGVYFYRLQIGTKTITKKLVVLK